MSFCLITHHSSLFMELEIDRRCPQCGAAVRSQAGFCPQCGRIMNAASTEASAPPQPPVTESAEKLKETRDGKEGDKTTRPLAVTAPSLRVSEPSSAATPPKTEAASLPAQIAREQIASGKTSEPVPESASRRRSQRVVGAARDIVEERLAPRVEKLRQASTVVWGEAQDDPNLRFILIAVFLFIVAIVIILLGTYLR